MVDGIRWPRKNLVSEADVILKNQMVQTDDRKDRTGTSNLLKHFGILLHHMSCFLTVRLVKGLIN